MLQRRVDQDGAASLRTFQTTLVTSACVRKESPPGSPACFLYRRRAGGFEEVLEVFPPPPSVSPAEVNSHSPCWGSTASPCQGTRWFAKVLFEASSSVPKQLPRSSSKPQLICFCLHPTCAHAGTNNGTWFRPIFWTEPHNTFVSAKSFRLPACGSKLPAGGDQLAAPPLPPPSCPDKCGMTRPRRGSLTSGLGSPAATPQNPLANIRWRDLTGKTLL